MEKVVCSNIREGSTSFLLPFLFFLCSLGTLYMGEWIWGICFTVIFFFFLMFCFSQIVEESVIVFQGLGIQLERKTRFGNKTVSFIPQHTIKRVVISETVSTFKAFFYLAIEVSTQNQVILPFENLTPRLAEIEPAYHLINKCLVNSRT